MKKSIAAIFAVLMLFSCTGCGQETKSSPLGVWWWNSDLPSGQYLEFASENGVSEIYYCNSAFDSDTEQFIKSANGYGIKVYWLAGEYQWLDDAASLYGKIEKYIGFQSENKNRFAGIHLDIEPHQNPDFKEKRTELLTKLVSLAHTLKEKYGDIKFDYDIPFWIEDEITFNGKTLPAYAHIVEAADRTFIMSYRDTAEAIYRVAEDEISFAQSVGKTMFLGVETYSKEGDSVSFMEEGKNYMYSEIDKLREIIPEDYGVAVHQIKTWYDLKN